MTTRTKEYGVIYVTHGAAAIHRCKGGADVMRYLERSGYTTSDNTAAHINALPMKGIHRENINGALASWFVIRLW